MDSVVGWNATVRIFISSTKAMNTNLWSAAVDAVKDVVLPIIPSLLGAVVSLQFLGRHLSWGHKLSSIGVGVVCAAYVSPVLVDWLGVQGKELHSSLEFLIALFALAIGREIFREIENGLLQKIRDRFIGGGK